MRALLVVAALLAAGCATPGPERASVDPPPGTEWAECPPSASRAIALALRAFATNETEGKPAGIHRLDARRFLYVWGQYEDTLREDRVTRINPVQVAIDGEGLTHVCARVDVSTPTDVDAEPRSYSVGVLVQAEEDLLQGPVRVVVNWVAGCPCDTLPRGNATARFE